MASNVSATTDGLATERWIDEGGHLAPEAVIEREVCSADRRAAARRRGRARPRVVIAGAGVAGLEALLALRALAGDRIDITLVAPELRLVNRSMAVAQPFSLQRVRGVRLHDVAAEHGARWHRGTLDRVERGRRVVVTKAAHELAYDMLVLALAARPSRTGPRVRRHVRGTRALPEMEPRPNGARPIPRRG
jgi:NADPH-dependent 2,4-dienoyl-CoA reductase/sulfur reductase-like enzyme